VLSHNRYLTVPRSGGMAYDVVLGFLAQEEWRTKLFRFPRSGGNGVRRLVELSGLSRTWLANVLIQSLHQLGLLSSLESNIANGSVEADYCQARGEIVQLDRSKLRQG
jgi:hypothetical protein